MHNLKVLLLLWVREKSKQPSKKKFLYSCSSSRHKLYKNSSFIKTFLSKKYFSTQLETNKILSHFISFFSPSQTFFSVRFGLKARKKLKCAVRSHPIKKTVFFIRPCLMKKCNVMCGNRWEVMKCCQVEEDLNASIDGVSRFLGNFVPHS